MDSVFGHIKIQKDWKPGAVSKRLLRMLNKAKLRKSTVEAIKRTRRAKKKTEEKPTLIVSKINGKYYIEMQTTSENPEEHNDQYTPLIYEIESTRNKAKIKQKERLQRRLIRTATNKVWSEAYRPESCEENCLRTYKQAIGVLPLKEDNYIGIEEDVETINSCSCEDEEVSLSCTSSEVNWEIHFTPPLMCYQALHQEEKNQLLV